MSVSLGSSYVLSSPERLITAGSVTWEISRSVRSEVFGLLPQDARSDYKCMVRGLRAAVVDYINASNRCDAKTNSISCLGGCDGGGKLLKVRCPLPGRGASRSLRVTLAVFCEAKRVQVVDASWRREMN